MLADIPAAPQLHVLCASLQRPLHPGLLRRLLLAGAPQLRHLDLTCSGGGGGSGGFDDGELATVCRLPHLSRLRFRCGAHADAAAYLVDSPSLRDVEISGWSCPRWPHAVVQGVAAALALRGGSLQVAGELISSSAREGSAGQGDVVPRLRYPRSTMLALRSLPGSQRSLRDCDLCAAVPAGLAAVVERW